MPKEDHLIQVPACETLCIPVKMFTIHSTPSNSSDTTILVMTLAHFPVRRRTHSIQNYKEKSFAAQRVTIVYVPLGVGENEV